MEYRPLGQTGLQISTIGLGTNNFGFRMDEESSIRVAHQAVEEGINFVDTANSYGRYLSEERIGIAFKHIRKNVIIGTKFGNAMGDGPNTRGASRHHIMQQAEGSLRALQTDYIDLYMIHRPDSNTPIEETLRAMDNLVHQGKVRYVGCSNFSAWQLCEAIWTSSALNLAPFVSVQNEYNMLNRSVEHELVPFCNEYNIGIVPFAPLAGGFLTGKYRQGEVVPDGTRFAGNERARERNLIEKNFAMLSKLEKFAQDRGHPMVELAIAWLLGNSTVCSVIAGATKPEQATENAKAADWHLTTEDMDELGEILKGTGVDS